MSFSDLTMKCRIKSVRAMTLLKFARTLHVVTAQTTAGLVFIRLYVD